MKTQRATILGASVASALAAVFLPGAQAQEAGSHDVRACGARSPSSLEPAVRCPGSRQLGQHAESDLRHPGAGRRTGTFAAVTPGDFKPSLAEKLDPASADGRTAGRSGCARAAFRFHGGGTTADDIRRRQVHVRTVLDPKRRLIASLCTPAPWRASRRKALAPSAFKLKRPDPLFCGNASSIPGAAVSFRGRRWRSAATSAMPRTRSAPAPMSSTASSPPRGVPEGLRRALGGLPGVPERAFSLHPRHHGAHAGGA